MKNITLSVDDEVLATVRRHAAERNSSVNALVRDYLTNLAALEDRAGKARARLRQLSARSQGRLGKKTWTRDELHDLNDGHQYTDLRVVNPFAGRF